MSACSPEQPLFPYPYRTFHLRHGANRGVVAYMYMHM